MNSDGKMSNHKMLQAILLIFGFAPPSAMAYTSSASFGVMELALRAAEDWSPKAKPSFDEPRTIQCTWFNSNKKSDKKPAFVSYDLGLDPQDSVHDAVKFLTESESTREYPNPNHHVAEKPKSNSSFRPLVPKRMNEEHFQITRGQDKVLSTIALKSSAAASQFELDTPWIEMLIHEQQLKYAHT